MKRLLRILFLSVLLGLVFLGADAFRMIGGKAGFPFAYNNPLTCGVIPFDGCGYSYDPIFVTLDYLFLLSPSSELPPLTLAGIISSASATRIRTIRTNPCSKAPSVP